MQTRPPRTRLARTATFISSLLALPALLVVPVACSSGPKAVRGTDQPGLDYAAMSTGLDRRDLQRMLNENMEAMRHSAVVQRWMQEDRPPLAVLPLQNETSEHIDSALNALLSDVETQLINWGAVRVISLQNQQQMIEEIRRQYAEGFDQTKIAHWGKQIGARYFVTGKVYTTDERVGDQRRVQYYLFMQVMNVETGEIMFQNKSNTTKAIIRD
ncbi:MAG: penicillin-binding protein activator LpoB [Polyangiales bacterium]